MDALFADWCRDEHLVWLPEKGMGCFPVRREDEPYDDSYFARYAELENTPIGRQLLALRLSLVARHAQPGALVCDVGIGSGAFVRARPGTKGFDIMPAAATWLKANDLFHDPFQGLTDVLTCWDSLEHVHDPSRLVRNARAVLVSLPVFRSATHALTSKHYRKAEHRWYWTTAGLIGWFAEHGFVCEEHNCDESEAGREDVETFAFVRPHTDRFVWSGG